VRTGMPGRVIGCCSDHIRVVITPNVLAPGFMWLVLRVGVAGVGARVAGGHGGEDRIGVVRLALGSGGWLRLALNARVPRRCPPRYRSAPGEAVALVTVVRSAPQSELGNCSENS